MGIKTASYNDREYCYDCWEVTTFWFSQTWIACPNFFHFFTHYASHFATRHKWRVGGFLHITPVIATRHKWRVEPHFTPSQLAKNGEFRQKWRVQKKPSTLIPSLTQKFKNEKVTCVCAPPKFFFEILKKKFFYFFYFFFQKFFFQKDFFWDFQKKLWKTMTLNTVNFFTLFHKKSFSTFFYKKINRKAGAPRGPTAFGSVCLASINGIWRLAAALARPPSPQQTHGKVVTWYAGRVYGLQTVEDLSCGVDGERWTLVTRRASGPCATHRPRGGDS